MDDSGDTENIYIFTHIPLIGDNDNNASRVAIGGKILSSGSMKMMIIGMYGEYFLHIPMWIVKFPMMWRSRAI